MTGTLCAFGDDQYGNAVDDGINAAAGSTDQAPFIQTKIAMAGRTGKLVEQVCVESGLRRGHDSANGLA
jgi:hypothetical protein